MEVRGRVGVGVGVGVAATSKGWLLLVRGAAAALDHRGSRRVTHYLLPTAHHGGKRSTRALSSTTSVSRPLASQKARIAASCSLPA